MSGIRVGLNLLPCLVIPLIVLVPARADAHPLTFTETTLTLRGDGTFQVEMICDLDALALGLSQDTDDAQLVAAMRTLAPDQFAERVRGLRELFRRRVRVRFDGEPAPFEVSFPDYQTSRADESEIPTVLGVTARLIGTIPPAATDVVFFASRSFADVHLTVVDDTRAVSARSVLERGARSDPFELTGAFDQSGRRQTMWRYAQIGFAHIVPQGADHILFVFGLFLLSPRMRPLVWQVTAFTTAHAVTLALGALDIVAVSPQLVEPAIALSIAWVAVENMMTSRLTPWRPAVVFACGLLHGLGFASVLAELGLPDNERLLALVAFNLGIELGQLSIIVLAFSILGWCRHRTWYRPRLVVPLSGGVAVIGLVWAVQRVLG